MLVLVSCWYDIPSFHHVSFRYMYSHVLVSYYVEWWQIIVLSCMFASAKSMIPILQAYLSGYHGILVLH